MSRAAEELSKQCAFLGHDEDYYQSGIALCCYCKEYNKELLTCISCSEPVNPDRWELGYHYCMKPECTSKQPSKLDNYRLILVPKQGFTYVDKDSPHLLGGKSSGRA